MATIVTGDQYYEFDAQLGEIRRQLRLKKGYPYDPGLLRKGLQNLIEGNFNDGVVGKIFATVQRGKYPTMESLNEVLEENEVDIDKSLVPYLNHIPISNKLKEVDLYRVTTKELGFRCADLSNIYERAFILGFSSCSIEALLLACVINKERGHINCRTCMGDGSLRLIKYSNDPSHDHKSLRMMYSDTERTWFSDDAWLLARLRVSS